jgi:nicotinamide-nucleotide amidase
MFVFALIKERAVSFRKVFKGSCEEIIHQTIEAMAEMLIAELKNPNEKELI